MIKPTLPRRLHLALLHLDYKHGLVVKTDSGLSLPSFSSWENRDREPDVISEGLRKLFPELALSPEEIEPLHSHLVNPNNIYLATLTGSLIPNSASAYWLNRSQFEAGKVDGLNLNPLARDTFLGLNVHQYGFTR